MGDAIPVGLPQGCSHLHKCPASAILCMARSQCWHAAGAPCAMHCSEAEKRCTDTQCGCQAAFAGGQVIQAVVGLRKQQECNIVLAWPYSEADREAHQVCLQSRSKSVNRLQCFHVVHCSAPREALWHGSSPQRPPPVQSLHILPH